MIYYIIYIYKKKMILDVRLHFINTFERLKKEKKEKKEIHQHLPSSSSPPPHTPHYHTTHLSSGFMGDPTGHFQISENSLILSIGTRTLNLAGEWGSVSTWFRSPSVVMEEHQMLALLRKNNCIGV